MKNFDKFGGITNNQVKTIIFMLRPVTEDLDYTLEVLLPEVIFFIMKDLFSISSKESKQYMWMEGLLMTEEHFEVKVGRIEVFLFSQCFLFPELLCRFRIKTTTLLHNLFK